MAVRPAVILIHGEGLGSWIWKDVAAQLESPCLTPDFPEREKAQCNVSLEVYFQHLVRQIDASGHEHLVLVCHAAGGLLGLMLARHYGSRVLGFVAIAGIIPADGKSYAKSLPWRLRFLHNAEGQIKSLFSDGKLALTAAGAAKLKKFAPEPEIVSESADLFKEACGAPVPEVRSLYIKCEADPVLPYSLQRQMRVNLNPSRVIKLPFGHLPMIDHSKRLSRLLQQFVNEVC